MALYLTLGVFALLVVGFISQKFPLGAVALTCVTILYLSGVLTFEEAYGNFANDNVILVGAMFILSAAIAKTPIVEKINLAIVKHAGGSGRRVVFFFLLATAILMQFIVPTACITMLLPFCLIMDANGTCPRTKSLYAVTTAAFMWQGVAPLAMGVGLTAQVNSFVEAGGGIGTATLMDRLIIGLLPAIIGSLVLLFISYKLLPDAPSQELSTDVELKEQSNEVRATTLQDKIIYVVFVLTMICMFIMPNGMYEIAVIPVVGCLVIAVTGCMSKKEIASSLNVDILFMLVGLLGLSTALENSGAAQLIANFIVSIIGADTHPFIVLAIFYFVANIVSQAFSNTGTMALLIPLMTTTCLTMGIDPVPVAMAVAYGANADSLLPMGSPGMAICFGSGGFKFTDLLLPGIVLMLIYGFSTVAMTYLTYFIL